MTAIAIVLIFVAILVVAYEMQESLKPQYRKDCAECAAHKRQAERQQEELAHDYQHRQGFKSDRYDCSDEDCRRNHTTR